MQELSQLQDKHSTRPDVFDDVEEEQEIEILTQEISQVSLGSSLMASPGDLCLVQMFSRAKRGLQSIQSQTKHASEQERRVAKNVSQSLAISLQELSMNFRKSQSSYLKSEWLEYCGVVLFMALCWCCVCMQN